MELNNAICTSVEQSKRLLELGLKKETADMTLFRRSKNSKWEISPDPYITWVNEILPLDSGYTLEDIIPAWSLGRLLKLCDGIAYDWLFRSDNYFENMVSCIEWMISKECLSKDYLEEKK